MVPSNLWCKIGEVMLEGDTGRSITTPTLSQEILVIEARRAVGIFVPEDSIGLAVHQFQYCWSSYKVKSLSLSTSTKEVSLSKALFEESTDLKETKSKEKIAHTPSISNRKQDSPGQVSLRQTSKICK